MTDRFEMLLQSKTWQELTNEEREFVLTQVESDEQYAAMRKVDLALNRTFESSVTPRPETLKSLRSRLNAERSGSRVFILRYDMPALAAVLLALIAAFIGWYAGGAGRSEKPGPPVQIVKTDTVFIKSPSDTIYVNRVVYRYVPQPAPKEPAFVVVRKQEEESRGVNMKEKEELDNLLVSGSE